MNDLDLITELRPDVALADPGELAPARDQLIAAIAAEFVTDSGASRPPRWPVRRLMVAGIAATAAAAGVAAALVIAPGGSAPPVVPPSAGHPASPAASGASHRVSHPAIRPFTGRLTAARFLGAAAHAALRMPAAPPRPGQFVYEETVGPERTSKYQAWLSADGSQDGLVINAFGPSSLTPCTVAQAEAGRCGLEAGYLPGLPTRPSRVLAYLTKVGLADPTAEHKPIPNWQANDVGKSAEFLLQSTYLLPAQRAALFNFMARTPGYTVAPHVADALGRRGVGIEWKYQDTTSIVIFSRKNYAYLGNTDLTGGHPTWAAALVKFAVVNRVPHPAASQLPPAKRPLKAKQGG
jgi:hypothetical protein